MCNLYVLGCYIESRLASYFREDSHMSDEVKPTRPARLNEEEVSEEIVNDSLGEITPADSTGLGSMEEADKREQPA
jgi:hypothetical protein